MRLIMLGTGPFAVPTLKALAASRHEVLQVVSRPPQGRKPTAGPLQQAAEALGLEVWSPETVNSPESQSRLASLAADLLVVCDYGEILHPASLATTRLGGINLHGSLLPKYRGAAPVQWAILRGETETGNSVIHMTPGLDAGPILAQGCTSIDPDEDAAQLEARLARLGAGLVLEVVAALEHGAVQAVEQEPELASKAPRLKKEQGAIDWSRPAQEIKDRVRGLRPWPRAYTFWHRAGAEPMRLNIDRVALFSTTGGARDDVASNASHAGVAPGTVIDVTTSLLIATADNPIEILTLQPAGKRAMPASEFLRGNRVSPGDRFGP